MSTYPTFFFHTAICKWTLLDFYGIRFTKHKQQVILNFLHSRRIFLHLGILWAILNDANGIGVIFFFFFLLASTVLIGPWPSSMDFSIHRHLVGLLGWGISPAQGLYRNTGQHNTERRLHTSMPRAGFEPAISMFKRS
jgi:hypothetical protein